MCALVTGVQTWSLPILSLEQFGEAGFRTGCRCRRTNDQDAPAQGNLRLTGQCARAIWCQGLAAYGDARSVARKLDSGSAGIDGGPRFRDSTIIGLQASERLSRKDRKSTRLNSVTNAHLVCRLLLEKKKKNRPTTNQHQNHSTR